MSKFEFTIAIVSVVLAVAATELIASWGRYIRRSEVVEFHGLYVAWSISLLFSTVIHWAGLWAYSDLEFASMRQLLVCILPGLFLAFSVHLFVPDTDIGLTLEQQYFRKFARFAPAFGSFFALSLLADLYLVGDTTGYFGWAAGVFALLVGILVARIKNLAIHRLLVITVLVYLVWGIFFDAGGNTWYTRNPD